MADGNMITVEQLVKVYPDGTQAGAGTGFTASEGKFFGFLGPNGAGKSTPIKILSALLKKPSGHVAGAST